MLARAMVRILGGSMPAQAGYRPLDGRGLTAISGDNQAITVAAIINGIVNRTVTTANTADTLPTVDSLLAALPDLSRGDSLLFSIRMNLAHTNTITLGAGMTAVGTKDIIASNIRDYILTLTSDNKRTRVVSGTTTNASLVLSNISATDLDNIGVGMAVTGTGIGASAKVTAVNRTNSTVLVDVVSTATADNIAITFTPQMDLLGLQTSAI